MLTKILPYTIFHDYSKCVNKQKKNYTILVKMFWKKKSDFHPFFLSSALISFLPPSSTLLFVSHIFPSISLFLSQPSLFLTVFPIQPAYRFVPHLYLKVNLNEVELYLCITKIQHIEMSINTHWFEFERSPWFS